MRNNFALLVIVGVLAQADIDALLDLGARAEAARVERFWRELACVRIVNEHASIIACIKDLEVFTFVEPK